MSSEYLADPAGVTLLPRTAEGLRTLQTAGFGLAVVTNQSGIGRGLFDETTLSAVHAQMRELLAGENVTLDGIYFCPHVDEDGCNCRKPRTGLAEQAGELDFDATQTYVVGDKAIDVELAKALGAVSILVRTGYGAATEQKGNCRPDYVADDLSTAAEWILQRAAK